MSLCHYIYLSSIGSIRVQIDGWMDGWIDRVTYYTKYETVPRHRPWGACDRRHEAPGSGTVTAFLCLPSGTQTWVETCGCEEHV